jgi:hypothetical protein
MSKDKYGQGERIARMIHVLVAKGSMSFPELKKKFPKFSEATLRRDVRLLKKTRLVIERREPRTTDGSISRKVFIFFKDDKDIVGKTKNAMESLRGDHLQVTLDQIASLAGMPPTQIEEAAYALAPELNLLIGKDVIGKKDVPVIGLTGVRQRHADESK